MRLPSVTACLVLTAALCGQSVNLALQGTATQSSTSMGGTANRAIDGSRDGFWQHNSVTMTQDAPGSWWQVSFPANFVHEVAVFNRSDSLWQRLSNFSIDVMLAGVVMTSRNYCTDGSWIDHGFCARLLLPTAGVPADAVRIRVLGPSPTGEQVLSLAEVEVIHYTGQPEVNLARFGRASITNPAFGCTGGEAIDGVFDGVLANGSVTCTQDRPGNAWRLLLPFKTNAQWIRIWNREDCCWQRLSNFRLSLLAEGSEVYGRNFYTNGGSVPYGVPESMLVPGSVQFDEVLIRLLGPGTTGEQVLSLAEVEVVCYGQVARVRKFGAACTRTTGVPLLDAVGGSAPLLGQSYAFQISGMTSAPGPAAVLIGASQTAIGAQGLPLDLGAFGAPGCQLLTSGDWALWLPRTGGVATGSVAIPADRLLLGMPIYQQAVSFDPAANALGAAFSDGAQWILGL